MFYRKFRIVDEIPEEMSDGRDIESEVLSREALDNLADALEKLDRRLRDIIILHYYGEKTLKEIAASMNMSYPNMKILHKKALDQLRELMG